ncbi:MAG: rhomboid family intramembrane serine protease [Tannerella sp.]|jgi:membrane associated rhomboid family serine protease|nr:rhomboid family intramembrane serine protease [Tannerella sp.]
MNEEEKVEKSELLCSVRNALILTVLPWAVHTAGVMFDFNTNRYGLIPLEITGLRGIFTMPFLHANWEHLISNTPALFLLLFGLFLFYGGKAWRILLYLYLLSGALTWLMGRETTHIGASGLVYALAAFHFVSGVIKKEPRQRAFALLVAFLYGGFIWAFFPTLYFGTSISWEGHLSGLLAGILFAFYYRQEGPKPPVYPSLEEEDEEGEFQEETTSIDSISSSS